MNYNLSRNELRNVASLNQWVANESFEFFFTGLRCHKYIFTNLVGGYSLIVHFIMSHNINYLKLIELPVSAIGCNDFECKSSEHTQGIDSLYESFIYACVKSAKLSIPSSSNRTRNSLSIV